MTVGRIIRCSSRQDRVEKSITLQKCNKKLARLAGIFFHPAMFSRINLTLGTALVAIGLCSFIQSSPGNEALIDLLALNDDDDVDSDSEDSDNTDPLRPRIRHRAVNTDGTLLPNGGEGLSMALIGATEAAEAESVIVTGSFDIYPVPYPALPPVEGTRINSGKKTSFVRPEEFPRLSQ
jgi:hypothetical protein